MRVDANRTRHPGEGGQKVGKSGFHVPAAPPFGEKFFGAARFWEPPERKSATPFHKSELDQEVNAMTRNTRSENRNPSAIYLLQLDLFRMTDACLVCGTTFEVNRYRGRPKRFCSDVCRFARAKEQKRAWSKSHSPHKGSDNAERKA